MTRVLLTAFQPYDRWPQNASWLTLQELTRELPPEPRVTTRLYPVEYDAARDLATADLRENYDLAIHLGQSPGGSRLQLEAIGLNVRQQTSAGASNVLLAEGPTAYQSTLPLKDWAARMVAAGIPAEVSYHAGTYLCNALLYYSLHYTQVLGLKTQSLFLHVPLDPSQTAAEPKGMPSLPVSYAAAAVRIMLEEALGL